MQRPDQVQRNQSNQGKRRNKALDGGQRECRALEQEPPTTGPCHPRTDRREPGRE